ncbi:MAG: hypothetical protein HUJ97_00350 [Bacteroidales bacterium]|nr:hypothetical protein [Bacteroidales bacterium]
MKSKEELSRYRAEMISQFGNCTILNVKGTSVIKNCSNTGNRTAHGGWSWINYWMAMTRKSNVQLKCSSCGKTIYAGPVPKLMARVYSSTGDSEENHRACGGHVWVVAQPNATYQGGRYITPLCPSCNGQHDERIPLLEGSILCKEIGAIQK